MQQRAGLTAIGRRCDKGDRRQFHSRRLDAGSRRTDVPDSERPFLRHAVRRGSAVGPARSRGARRLHPGHDAAAAVPAGPSLPILALVPAVDPPSLPGAACLLGAYAASRADLQSYAIGRTGIGNGTRQHLRNEVGSALGIGIVGGVLMASSTRCRRRSSPGTGRSQ